MRVEGDAASLAAPAGWRGRLPFFYGWLVVAVAFITLALIYVVWYGFSVFFVALIEDFGWSRASAAGAFSVFVMVSGLGGIVTGALTDRFGPEKILPLGAAIIAVGFIACGQMSELWQFYLFYSGVAAIGVATAGWVPCVATVNRWFSARLGTALGLTSAGVAAGILVMVPLAQYLISTVGWRHAYLVLAVAIFVGVGPLSWLVMRDRPESLGLRKDGVAPSDASTHAAYLHPQVVDRAWASTDWTLVSASRTGRFWLLFLMMTLANVFIQMVFVHQVAFLVDGGYDKMVAASIVGLIGFVSMLAKVGWGWASDRLGREVSWTLGSVSLLVSIVLLIMTRLAPFPLAIYLFSFTFAIGYGAVAPLMPAISADLFAGRNFGAIYGALGVANGVGSAFGAWLAGYIFDLTGSYIIAFFLAMVLSVVCMASVWFVAPRKVRRVQGRR